MISSRPLSFAEAVTEAVREFATTGYRSEERLRYWLDELRAAALRDMVPEAQLMADLRRALGAEFSRLVDRGELLRHTPGASRFTLERVRPELRAELDRRIMASANLIRLNREEAVAQTLRRFSGWATSVPPGGDETVRRNPVKSDIRKALASLPYVERRLHVDQGHKLLANLSDVLARGSGALAMRWRQHHTRYPRETHALRDGRTYLIRGTWATERGLVRPQEGSGYLDEITQPGQEVNCRCTGTYLLSLRQLPDEMLTEKGRAELEHARNLVA